MLRYIYGTFSIAELDEDSKSRIPPGSLSLGHPPFQSPIAREGYDFLAHSSTVWNVYAKDIVDGSDNLIKFEPWYFEDSPNLVPDVGIAKNVFSTEIDSIDSGNTLLYFPGTFNIHPFEWSGSDLTALTNEMLKAVYDEISIEKSHFIDGSRLANPRDEDVDPTVQIILGSQSVTGLPSGFVLVSKNDPLTLRSNSDVVDHWLLEKNRLFGERTMAGYEMEILCQTCNMQIQHLNVNYRDESGRYVERVYECQGCSNLVSVGR